MCVLCMCVGVCVCECGVLVGERKRDTERLGESSIFILHSAHKKIKSVFYFKLKSNLCHEGEIINLFEIMQFCFLHFILLFLIFTSSAENIISFKTIKVTNNIS